MIDDRVVWEVFFVMIGAVVCKIIPPGLYCTGHANKGTYGKISSLECNHTTIIYNIIAICLLPSSILLLLASSLCQFLGQERGLGACPRKGSFAFLLSLVLLHASWEWIIISMTSAGSYCTAVGSWSAWSWCYVVFCSVVELLWIFCILIAAAYIS